MSESKYVVIDGSEVEYREGETVLQAARRIGIEIPTLCHDDRLEPVGACRMCLVEVDGSRLMQPACSFKAAPGMVVRIQILLRRAVEHQDQPCVPNLLESPQPGDKQGTALPVCQTEVRDVSDQVIPVDEVRHFAVGALIYAL